MKQGIFKRIFILYGVILLMAALGAELTVTGAVRQSHISRLRDNLSVQAGLIAGKVPFNKPGPQDDLSRGFKEITASRVTIVAQDGRVMGDSDHDSSSMANHLDRVEIQQASLSGTGMAVRRSDTLDTDLLYVARQITRGEEILGFVRLSVPLRDVDAAVNSLRIRIILAVASILLATGLFPLWQIEHLRRLTVMIRDFALAVSRGDLGKRLFISRAGEYDEIADSLNAMSVELEKSIAASEEEKKRLNVILRNIPDALLIINTDDVIQLTSAAAGIYFGGAPLRGKRLIEVIRNREFLLLMDEVRGNLAPGVVEFKLDHPAERYFAARVSPLSYTAGEVSGFVAIFHDITRLKRLEQARKDFVANLSHELKTPVTAISGFADTLLEGALDDRGHALKFIETIKANSERINSLVDDLMTISKIELGVIKVEKSAVAVRDAVEHVLTLLRDKAAEKKLYIRTSIAPSTKSIMADRDRLIQILTNLADNAIKFTDTGGVTIGALEEDGRICMFVEDTGIGVPQKHLPRLGERFYRVDPGRSRNMGGTGLGLAIVKHLVKAHGWDMQIESAPGKGTKVRVFI